MQQLQYIAIGDPDSPSFTFEGDDILSISGDFSVDIIGADLCTDVMEAVVSYDDSDGTLRALPWATPVYFYRGPHLEGKLYSTNVTRTGRTSYRIRTTSAAGILQYDTFYGGMYAGETLKTVAERIIGTNGLQPFSGVYPHYYRKEQAGYSSFIFSYGLGAYADMNKVNEYPDGVFLSATMGSKMSAKVKILGFVGGDYVGGTSFRCMILGAVAYPGGTSSARKHQYGLYMEMTRPDTAADYPAFGEVFFVYGRDQISLGTPASADEAVYELNVNPNTGRAVINGVTYSLSIDVSVINDLCALHVCGGGVSVEGNASDNVFQYNLHHYCELEVFYYTIRSSADVLQAGYALVKDVFTGELAIYDYVSQNQRRSISFFDVSDSDLVPYDTAVYGASPLFCNRTECQKDVLSRVAYAPGIDTISIRGWIRICSKREAIHQLLIATGVIIIKNEDGSLIFTEPSEQPAGNIDDDAIYDEGSEDLLEHINAVVLTEHTYTLDTLSELETIYENNESDLGRFYIAEYSNAPAKQEDVDGLTCYCANCNAAVVGGTGKLLGRGYSHTERVLRREITTFPDGRAASVTDATLVTLLNRDAVMDRLAAYYGSAHRTRVGISTNGEKCGLTYTLKSAFLEAFSGFLVKMNMTASAIVRAECEFISGYVPPSIDGSYTHYEILTGSGTWTVPAFVLEKASPRIYVVLIGGGQGGDGGYAGADGDRPEPSSSSSPAEGGAVGNSGAGGKILEIAISNPAASYEYRCGLGGAGGIRSLSHEANSRGLDGGDTTFSGGGQSYSSANGASDENGISNLITGDRYAGRLVHKFGENPPEEGSGGAGGYFVDYYGLTYRPANETYRIIMNEWDGEIWRAGKQGEGYYANGGIIASGGAGGGAGYGQAGSNGSDASYSHRKYHSGNGGKGGDATETPLKATDYNPTFYGYGGLGGGGGGGGGAGGWNWEGASYVAGAAGAGGYGGAGGDGGDGCVLIYY